MNPRSFHPWKWRIGWTVVFALNVILPFILGWQVLEGEGGRAGMIAGAATVALAGDLACRRSRTAAAILVYGGWIALGSILFLPVMAGRVGMYASLLLGLLGDRRPGPAAELGGFLTTIVTGGVMIAAGSFLPAMYRIVQEMQESPQDGNRSGGAVA